MMKFSFGRAEECHSHVRLIPCILVILLLQVVLQRSLTTCDMFYRKLLDLQLEINRLWYSFGIICPLSRNNFHGKFSLIELRYRFVPLTDTFSGSLDL